MGFNEAYPFSLPAGSILAGQYIIEKTLGQGGFGITYQAVDHKTGQKVAVKEFFPDTMAARTTATTVTALPGERGESFVYGKECFLQEAETLAQFIGNENIVKVYSYFEENGTAYFVMEYIEGTSFDRYIRDHGGRVSYEEAEKILLPIIDALAAVHARGIVHRDVTPDNIYITKEGRIKLLDFGAARYSLGDRSRSLDVVLKHGFAPKEQYTRHGRQGPFTDVYTVGATFYFAITGRRPPDSIDRIEEDELVPPGRLGVKIPPNKEDAVLKAMNVQPGSRYQTMGEFWQALTSDPVMSQPAQTADVHNQPVQQRFFAQQAAYVNAAVAQPFIQPQEIIKKSGESPDDYFDQEKQIQASPKRDGADMGVHGKKRGRLAAMMDRGINLPALIMAVYGVICVVEAKMFIYIEREQMPRWALSLIGGEVYYPLRSIKNSGIYPLVLFGLTAILLCIKKNKWALIPAAGNVILCVFDLIYLSWKRMGTPVGFFPNSYGWFVILLAIAVTAVIFVQQRTKKIVFQQKDSRRNWIAILIAVIGCFCVYFGVAVHERMWQPWECAGGMSFLFGYTVVILLLKRSKAALILAVINVCLCISVIIRPFGFRFGSEGGAYNKLYSSAYVTTNISFWFVILSSIMEVAAILVIPKMRNRKKQ